MSFLLSDSSDEEEKYLNVVHCGCGYHPDTMEKCFFSSILFGYPLYAHKYLKCSETKALKNHMTFPSFELLSDYNNPSDVFYEEVNASMIKPSRNWAFLIEIEKNISFIRQGLVGHSQFGERLAVYFYEKYDSPTTFSWSEIKKGNTLVILYALKKMFLDGTLGIRQENLDTCYVFKANLVTLEQEASKLLDLKDSNFTHKKEKCFSCGLKKESLGRCAKCKLAVYCSKECQKNSWLTCHKNLCFQFDILLRLASLPRREKFQEFYSFDPLTLLPEYIYSEKHIQNV